MLIGHIEGATRVLGKSQGYIGLPVRDEIVETEGGAYRQIVSAWLPTPEEVEAIVAGAPILLTQLCVTPPPMLMGVGSPPSDELEIVDAPTAG
jgi:hypothetical protein